MSFSIPQECSKEQQRQQKTPGNSGVFEMNVLKILVACN
jgi:hypothetical protein